MAEKRFKSKVDRWIWFLMIIMIITMAWSIGFAAINAGDPLATTGLFLLGIAVIALSIWLLLGTYYSVYRGTLKIVSGPIRWKVEIDQIQSVEATKSPLSSPALSLDRIRIRYGKNRKIMISPADKPGFLKAIGHELET